MTTRERFEAWAEDHYATLHPESWNVDYYGDTATAAAYAAWLAATEAAAKVCDERADAANSHANALEVGGNSTTAAEAFCERNEASDCARAIRGDGK